MIAFANFLRRGWLWAGLILIVGFAAVNWERTALFFAMVLAERRPALLRDAAWNDPASAGAFNERFPPGTPEGLLIAWLEENNFTINRPMGHAGRLIQGFPCNESIQVDWTAAVAGKIDRAEVRVSEAGCL